MEITTTLLATAFVMNSMLLCWADDIKMDPKKFDIHTNTLTQKGKCVRRVRIEGNGVRDSVDAKCVSHVVEVLRTSEALVYGHPPADTFYMYTDKPYHLVVVNEGNCIKKKYSVRGRKTRVAPMSADDCAAVRKTVEELYSCRDHHCSDSATAEESSANHDNKLDPKKFIVNTNMNLNKGACERTVTIKGNGVKDSFKTGCSDNGEKIVRKNGVMLYGIPPDDSFYMYSDQPSTLLVFDEGKCTKRTYSGDKKTTTSLSDEDCAELFWKAVDLYDSESGNDVVSSGGVEHTQSAHSQPLGPSIDSSLDPGNFHINTNTITINGECVRTVSVEGNIVSDTFQTGCSTQGVNVARQNGIMIYGQPPQDTFYLYCDSQEAVVVIQDGKCVKKTYSSKGREPTSTPLRNADCDAVKKKVADLTSKHSSPSQVGSLLQKLNTSFGNIFKSPNL